MKIINLFIVGILMLSAIACKSTRTSASKTIGADTVNKHKQETITSKPEEIRESTSPTVEDVEEREALKAKLRSDIVNEALQYLGRPYCSGGFSSDTCFDCSGLTKYVYQKFGITLPPSSYDQFVNGGETIPHNMVKPADLIYFKGYDKSTDYAGHVGIVLEVVGDDIIFIHASTSKGVIKSKLSQLYYKERFLGVKRYLP